jgi:hypothetical protein
MSAVTDFLEGKGKDHRSRGIKEILDFDNEHIEGVHDYIQWLFPLPESSAFNTFAPILTFSDIDILKRSTVARRNIVEATSRMLASIIIIYASAALSVPSLLFSVLRKHKNFIPK